MEALLTTLLPIIGPGGIGVLAAIIVYLKINNQRKETKTERDQSNSLLEYRVGQLEVNQSSLAESIKELQNSIIALQMSINTLIVEVKNLKEDK